MRWSGNGGGNIEDRRGMGPVGVGGLGAGGVILALVGYFFFGIDPSTTTSVLSGGGAAQQQEGVRGTPADEAGRFRRDPDRPGTILIRGPHPLVFGKFLHAAVLPRAQRGTRADPERAVTRGRDRPDFAGETTTPILPLIPFGIPGLSVRSVQVEPPSFDRKSPDPGPPLLRKYGPRCASQNET